MLGMRRSKLFGMLLAEDFLTSILAMLIGLPVAVVLSEIVSLVTAKLVGMGIIGHQFSLSWSAIEWTLAGFLAIKLTALLILSGRISRQEIGTLLSQPTNRPKKQMPSVIYGLAAICGSVMLAVAYYMAIQGIAWTKVSMMGLTLLLGIVGTMLLFYGMRALIALIVKKGKGNKQLHVFTFRQIQENVIHQSTSMAISSLLILAALCCFGAGVGIAGTNSLSSGHVIDYTFEDHTAEDSSQVLPNIKAALKENGLENQFSELFEMRVGRIRTTEDYDNAYSMDAVMDSLRSLPQSEDRDVLLNNLGYATYPAFLHHSIQLYYPLSCDCFPGSCQHHRGCSVPDESAENRAQIPDPDPPGSYLRNPLPVCWKANYLVYGTSCIGCGCQQSVWSQGVIYRDTLVPNPWDSV